MTDPARLAAELRRLLGPGIGVGQADPVAPAGSLWPEEAPAVRTAIRKRQLEFTAGRVAARLAMAEIGAVPAPVLQATDRAPVWPAGLAGSIAHCDTACIAAVARLGQVRSVGIDIEEATPLAPELEEVVCTRTERTWLARQPNQQRGLLAKLIFSAKESVYKAQYPLSRELIGYEAVEITLTAPQGTFSAIFMRAVGPMKKGATLAGQLTQPRGLLMTSVIIGA